MAKRIPTTYRTAPKMLESARRLRHEMTMAEKKLWGVLRNRQIDGHFFRHQVPIGKFVADFCCLKARLIIEVDGGQHADSARDDARTQWLENEGYRVLRFWNNEVLQNLEGVRDAISIALTEGVQTASL